MEAGEGAVHRVGGDRILENKIVQIQSGLIRVAKTGRRGRATHWRKGEKEPRVR